MFPIIESFWKIVKPLFSNKVNYGNRIKLVENKAIIYDETKVAEELNNFFKIAVASLDIHGNQHTVENVENISDPVDKAKKNFSFIQAYHLSKLELPKTVIKIYFVLMK